MASDQLTEATTGHPRSDRRRWLTAGTVVGLGFSIWALRLGLRPIHDNSFFTHLATGRLIVTDGVPHRDPYTFTSFGHQWVVQSWLASLVYGLLDHWWGTRALQLFTGGVATVLGVVLWRLTRVSDGLLVRIVLMLAAVVVATEMWSERPLLLGLLAFALVMLAVQQRRAPLWLVPLGWIWTNVHGSFPLGLVAIAAIAIGTRLDGEKPSVELRALALLAGGVVAGALNPFGLRQLIFPVSLLRRSDELKFIVEWAAPKFDSTPQRVFLLMVVAAVVALMKRPQWRSAIPILLFTVMALTSVRNISVASIVIVAALAPLLAGIGSLRSSTSLRSAPIAVVALVMLGGLVVNSAFAAPALQTKAYPTAALAFLDERGLLDGTHRVVTRDYVGNFLEAAYGATGSVFVDDRIEVVEPELLADHKALVYGEPGWSQLLSKYRADAVVWTRSSPLTRALELDSHWRIAFVDREWVVALPR